MPWPTVPVVTTGMDADTDTLPRPDILDHTQKFNQLIAMRGVAEGVCDLNSSGQIPAARLPGTYQPLDDQLTTLAGITAQQASDLASLSTLIGTLLNDTTQPTALATLGAPLNAMSSKSANYTVVAADMGKFFTVSGSTTISLTAAATLGANFSFSIRNAGVNTVIIDPNGAETIDGVASVSLLPGETCFVICNGTSWTTVSRASNPFEVSQNLSPSGGQGFPGRLAMRWGVTASVANGAGRTATFDTPFANACFVGFVMGTIGGGTAEANHVVTGLSLTGLTFTNNSATTQPFYYFAIGY